MSNIFKPRKVNWRHYFGGFGLLTLILQLLTGLYLIFFFDPTLSNAYKSVQYISNELFLGSFSRNLHRWIAMLLLIAIVVHTVRSFLRMDFLDQRKRVVWMTGVLLLLPLFLFVVTGLVVPWEWKGYFFMAMIPNYFEPIPVIGPALKDFFNQSFTIPRYYVFHILVLPIISFVLVDYHMLVKLRKRGIFKYLLRHTVATLPLVIILFILSIKLVIPSNDPVEVPLPLEGAWVPTPEWHFLTVLLPYMYLRGTIAPVLGILLPMLLLIGVAFMPYYLKRFSRESASARLSDDDDDTEAEIDEATPESKSDLRKKVINGVIVTAITLVITGLLFLGNYNSPTLGCNSCHNLNSGFRMGLPPDNFKDRSKLPHLDENDWMMKHWYYPNEVW